MTAVRIGVLGAARLARMTLLRPAAALPDVEVRAVAARDPERGTGYAARHGIPTAHEDYSALLADPEVDAVYIPLPNGAHGRWTLAAAEAGKHVLCEAPLAANATEAQAVAEAASGSGLVVAEAMHYRYHPLLRRTREVLDSGEIGTPRSVSVAACLPYPRFRGAPFRLGLAGGALMGIGCYAADLVRVLGGASTRGEPEVVSARSRQHSTGVDRTMRARLRFAGGPDARLHASLWSATVPRIVAHVQGDDGHLRVLNPLFPQAAHQLAVRTGGDRRVEHFPRRSTYSYQLAAFAGAVRGGEAGVLPLAESAATMRLIDGIYRAAGLPEREPVAG